MWVIHGETGEYSDYRWWILCVVETETKADAITEYLNGELDKRQMLHGVSYYVSCKVAQLGRNEARKITGTVERELWDSFNEKERDFKEQIDENFQIVSGAACYDSTEVPDGWKLP